MEKRELKFQLKALDEAGKFTGIAAAYNNVDLGQDMILPGAFTKTLADKGGAVPILWQHQAFEPIGMGKLSDSGGGVMISGDLAIDASPAAMKAYQLLKRGILKGLSIGYDTLKSDIEQGVRKLKELKLWEVSLVTFPMNPMAGITSIKGSGDDVRNFIALIRECRLELGRTEARSASVPPPNRQIELS